MRVMSSLLSWAFDPSLIATSRPIVCLKQMRLRQQFMTTSLIKEVTVEWIQHKGGPSWEYSNSRPQQEGHWKRKLGSKLRANLYLLEN